MFTLILLSISISALILCILWLLYKNHDLQIDNEKLSHQTNELLRENSKLRKELL